MYASGSKISGGHIIVYRGTVPKPDFEAGDITIDGAYHDLDLSGIIPAGSFAALISTNVKCNAVGDTMVLIHPDDSANERSTFKTQVNVLNKYSSGYGIVFCNTSYIIKYKVTAGVTVLQIHICGWIIV